MTAKFMLALFVCLVFSPQARCPSAVAPVHALALAGGAGRVVFVRDSEIYTASENGSNLRQLTSDGKPKQMPKWSPDGTEIAYLTSGDMSANPKSRAKIEIITVDGKHVGTAPILVTMADGTEVGGMRWVDSIGWFDAQHVFAEGSINPHSGEFRTINIRSGQMGGYGGFGFSRCPQKGQIAFWAPTFPPDKRMRVEVNGQDTDRLVFPDWDKLPDIHIPLLWTPGCQNVAVVDPRQPAALVLIGANHGARGVPLPDWPCEVAQLALFNGNLLMRGAGKALVYDFRHNTVAEAPQALLKRLDAERAARERVVRELKGESPDWWTPPPSVRSSGKRTRASNRPLPGPGPRTGVFASWASGRWRRCPPPRPNGN